MGQYYQIVNLDKKEYMNNHDFGGGIKLIEHGGMILKCLVALLAESNGRGGGDIRSENSIIGSWAGNRIMFAGDYADPNPEFSKPTPFSKPIPIWNEERHTWENGPAGKNVYEILQDEEWKNIGVDIFLGMLEDPWFKEYFIETYVTSEVWYRDFFVPDVLVALAYALKNVDIMLEYGNKAAWAFRTLFGDGTQEYYRAMNGLIKNHNRPRVYGDIWHRELELDK